MDQMIAPALPRIAPPTRRPTTLGILRAMLRNPIEAWPASIYEQPFLQFNARFGGTTTFLCDPDLVRRALVEHADSLVRTRYFLRALKPALGEAILTSDGPRWRGQRRIAAPVFRHDRLRAFVPPMLEAARATRARWEALPDGTTIGLANEMMRTTFDIIAETMLSGSGGLDVDRIGRSITRYLENLRWQVVYGMLGLPEGMPYPGRRALERANRFMRGEVERVVRDRRRAGDRRGDLIDLMIEAEDPDGDGRLGDRDVTDNLLTFIAAGHETTALVLTFSLYLLAKHPAARARALTEIAAVTAGGEVEPAHLDRLGYLRQVVQEAMRLYPPAAIIPRTAARAIDLGALTIPDGSNLVVPVYAIHRHRRHWTEPDTFDPERFTPEPSRDRPRAAYFPFGAGPRICIGMNFAVTEAVAILAVLLPAALLAPLDERNLHIRHSITLRPTNGMPMRLSRPVRSDPRTSAPLPSSTA